MEGWAGKKTQNSHKHTYVNSTVYSTVQGSMSTSILGNSNLRQFSELVANWSTDKSLTSHSTYKLLQKLVFKCNLLHWHYQANSK